MRSLIAFRLTSTHKDYCVVGTDAGKITILEFLPDTSEVRYDPHLSEVVVAENRSLNECWRVQLVVSLYTTLATERGRRRAAPRRRLKGGVLSGRI